MTIEKSARPEVRRGAGALLRRVGVLVIGLALAAGLAIVFLALPPFQTGIWIQSEPVGLALHAVAALAALGLALALFGGSRAAGAAIRHPFVLLPGALGLCGLALAPSVDIPLLSWFGTPELGEGIAGHFDLAALIAGSLVMRRYRRLRRGLAWIALAGATGAAALTVHTEARWAWAPFWFYDYLAFYGIFVTVILLGALRPRAMPWRLAVVAYGFAVVVLSGNRAAIVLALVLVPAVWGGLWLLRRRAAVARWLAAAGVAAMPLVMIPAVIQGGESGIASLHSRLLHLEVSGNALRDAPLLLINGQGWGRHGDRVNVDLPARSVDFLADRNVGADWDAVSKQVHFHSHHFLVEALLSVGVLGLLLAWAIPVALPLCCRRERIAEAGAFAVLSAALFSLWFQLPGSVPYMALAFAAIARPGHARPTPARARSVAATIMFAVAIILAATAISGTRVAATMFEAARANRDTEPLAAKALADCGRFLTDSGRGGVHLATLFRSFTVNLTAKLAEGRAILDQDVARLRDYICAYRREMTGGRPSWRLASVGLIVRSELAFVLDDPKLKPVANEFLADWGTALGNYLARARRRGDMAVPYLSWRLAAGDDAAVVAMASRILAGDRDDPVGLWFSGTVLIATPETAAEGIARMRRALALGLERIMPVDAALKTQIRSAPGTNGN